MRPSPALLLLALLSPCPLSAQNPSQAGDAELIEFSYDWPAEAARVPALVRRFERERAAARAEALANAREDKATRGADAEFFGHSYGKSWQVMGASQRILSLSAETATFTGGAHGNVTYDGIVWDSKAGRDVGAAGLFSASAGFQSLSKPYCAALDTERAERRQESLPLQGDDWMVKCPALASQIVVPVDSDGDGRFEAFRILLPPYEAGPYAEGPYEVDVPVTPSMRAAIRPEYRGSFE